MVALGRLKQGDHHELEASMGYRVSSSPTWAAQQDPTSKKKNLLFWFLSEPPEAAAGSGTRALLPGLPLQPLGCLRGQLDLQV